MRNTTTKTTNNSYHHKIRNIFISFLVFIIVTGLLYVTALWRITSPLSIDPPTFYNNMALMGTAQNGYDVKTKSVGLTGHVSDYPSGTSTFIVPLDMRHSLHIAVGIRFESPKQSHAEGMALALRQASGSPWKRGDGGGGLGLARMKNLVGFKIDLNRGMHAENEGYKFSNDPSSVTDNQYFGSWVATGITSTGTKSPQVADNFLQGIDTDSSVKLLPAFITDGQFHTLVFDYSAQAHRINITFARKQWKLDVSKLIDINRTYWICFAGAASSINDHPTQEFRIKEFTFVPSRHQ